jgi:hypothetical protein
LLDECIACVHDLSEADIVRLLRFYLTAVSEDAAAAFVRAREAELPVRRRLVHLAHVWPV